MDKRMTSGKDKRRYGVRLVRGPYVRLDPHPGHCTDDRAFLELARRCARPKAADLFCGAGGLSLGLRDAGFDVILGVDSDPEAIETHASLFPGLSATWDLAEDDVIERVARLIREAGIDLVAGGPPCQPFSRAGRSLLRELVRTGRRPGHDHRRDLWQSFLAVVELSRPPAVLMENVPDMALDRDMMILRTMVDELEHLGYSVHTRLVESWRYGVPQYRSRLIMVALEGGLRFEWPGEVAQKTTVENAIGDLPPVAGGDRPEGGADGFWEYGEPVTAFQRRARATVGPEHRHRIYDHITRPVREDDLIAFSQMDPTTRYSDLAPELRRYRDDAFDDKYKRLDADDLSRTITAHIAKDGYWYIHPWQDRTLTVREAARLQTFTDDVRFAGPPSAAFRQIGNAVPPMLAEVLGRAILRAWAAPEPQPFTTQDIARRLGDWFHDRSELSVPWLRARTRWQVLQCELLLDRMATAVAARAWRVLSAYESPAATLEHLDDIAFLLAPVGRAERVTALAQTAEYFLRNPAALLSVDGMASAPNVQLPAAHMATRVVLAPDGGAAAEDPVLATAPTLRVAARFWGSSVDQRNQHSEGRMAVVRLVGVEPLSDEAHLGLLELADSHCRPRDPLCSGCPLDEWCAESASNRRGRPRLF